MKIAENIGLAYQSSMQATNWAEWTQSNPHLAKMLIDAQQQAHGLDDDAE